MKEEQIIKLLVEGGPGAAAAFDAYLNFKYVENFSILFVILCIVAVMAYTIR